MAQKIVYICDGCSHEKGVVNHWHEVYEDSNSWEARRFAEPDVKRDPTIRIYCGQGCVVKAFSEYLERCREKVEV